MVIFFKSMGGFSNQFGDVIYGGTESAANGVYVGPANWVIAAESSVAPPIEGITRIEMCWSAAGGRTQA